MGSYKYKSTRATRVLKLKKNHPVWSSQVIFLINIPYDRSDRIIDLFLLLLNNKK